MKEWEVQMLEKRYIIFEHFGWNGSSQGEDEEHLHPADVMEQNHNNVEGEEEEEEAEEPHDEGGEHSRGVKRQLVDVKMEPGGGGVR